MKGGYNLFMDLGYAVDFVNLDGDKTFDGYKVVYLPYYIMADVKNNDKLKAYVENGGILICDEGFALRDRKNTWLQIHDIPFDFMSARMKKRRMSRGTEKFALGGQEVTINPYRTWYETNGKSIASFADGEPAIQEISYGKGKILLFSASMGYSYKMHKEQGWCDFMKAYLSEHCNALPKKYADGMHNVHHQTLYVESGTIEIIQNYSQKIFELEATEAMQILTEQKAVGGKISLQPTEAVCYFVKK
jgi:hypothetical protein